MKEMRTLSKLRHPCITTIMGAIVARGCEPIMVMEYMELGSLYAILHNETTELDGETRYYLVNFLEKFKRGGERNKSYMRPKA